jgi:hypothetical protein
MVLPAQFTIEAWVYPVALSSSRYWLSWWQTGANDCMTMNTEFTSTLEWHHVLITWDGTITRQYQDGALRSHFIGFEACSHTGTLTLAQEQDTDGGTFETSQAPEVYVDTLAVYNTAWSAAKVASLAPKSCVHPDATDLEALYLPGGGSSTVLDSAPNGEGGPPATAMTLNELGSVDGVAGLCGPSPAPSVSFRPTTSERPTVTPTPFPTGVPTQPWYFPGRETSQYFQLSAMTFPSGAWTIETWVYPLEVTSGRYWFSFWSTTTGGDCMTFTSDFSSANEWHHIVVTWDGTAALKAYDNGALRSGITSSQGCGSGAFTGTLTLAQEQDSEGGTFDSGQAPALHIDTFAIYTNTWSAADAAETASKSCLDDFPYPSTLRSLYIGDGSGTASDVLGNNPAASIVSSSTIAGHSRCRSPQN